MPPKTLIDFVCPICGIVQQIKPFMLKRKKTCSKQCGDALQRNRIQKTCLFCANTYKVIPAEAEKSKYCSRKCRGQWMKANRSGENSPQWKGGDKKSFARYCQTNPQKRAELSSKRRMKIKKVEYEKVDRQKVIDRDNGICIYCGDKPTGRNLTLDHLIPISRGGKHTEDNLRVACLPCNSRKGQQTFEEFINS